MATSNLMFALMASVGSDKILFVATVSVDDFTAAWGKLRLWPSYLYYATKHFLLLNIF
ncbi:MAG: hypothetical protein ACI936_002219 [Paraglaciecola sp.]|jgi:hypothetical protein